MRGKQVPWVLQPLHKPHSIAWTLLLQCGKGPTILGREPSLNKKDIEHRGTPQTGHQIVPVGVQPLP